MDILKSNIVVGVSAALAVTVLAPVLVPILATVGRPLAKSLLKGGLLLYEKSREAVAQAGESVEDMVAEIRAEEATRGAEGDVVPAQAATKEATRPEAAPAPVASAEPRPASVPAQSATAEQPRSSTDGGAGSGQGSAGTQVPQAGVAAI